MSAEMLLLLRGLLTKSETLSAEENDFPAARESAGLVERYNSRVIPGKTADCFQEWASKACLTIRDSQERGNPSMKSASRFAVVLLLIPALLPGQSNKKKTVSAVFSNARYAWVESMDGDAYTPRTIPEDRQAISDVEDALRNWNRYALTVQRSEADLVFIVRKGRLATGKLGVGIGNPPLGPNPGQRSPGGTPGTGTGTGTGTGVGVGGEVGPPDDILEVRTLNTDGTLGTILWQRSLQDGLDGPQVTLLAQLRKAVEKDYPQGTQAKP